MAAIVPDGIVCFFPSYGYMEDIVGVWNEVKNKQTNMNLKFKQT